MDDNNKIEKYCHTISGIISIVRTADCFRFIIGVEFSDRIIKQIVFVVFYAFLSSLFSIYNYYLILMIFLIFVMIRIFTKFFFASNFIEL